MLISAIIPTRGRPLHAHRALACAMAQKWPSVEVVIVDDLDNRSFATAPEFEGVHYHLCERRLSTGEKRNRCCELARGEIIAHFDDDDFSAPERFSDQVDRLMSSGAMLTGYHSMLFVDERTGERFMFRDKEPFALGTSFMYRREFWQRNQFPAIWAGEDTIFLSKAQMENAVTSVAAGCMMLARIHGGNTVTKKPGGSRWERIAA